MIDTPKEMVVRVLVDEMRRIKGRVQPSRWFLFGSITKAKKPPGDIDLLIVCETTAHCALVRAELASICERFPIHLLLMTLSEEAETEFIQSERAVEITSGDSAAFLH